MSRDLACLVELLMVVRESNLLLVLVRLVVFPGFLTHSLLQCQSLVFGLQLLKCIGALRVVLVLKHASHAGKGLSLLRVRHLFLSLHLLCKSPFSHLLVCPVLLVLGVNHHATVIHCNEKLVISDETADGKVLSKSRKWTM